nr:unnamed protein product [Callosobruchus analis]
MIREADKWTMIKPMHFKRLAVGVGVVNRLLYAIGGYDGYERHSSVECYHPEITNGRWCRRCMNQEVGQVMILIYDIERIIAHIQNLFLLYIVVFCFFI